MEEILNSIRGVIGEDASADTPEVEELKMDDDIMDLTEEWVDDSAADAPPPRPTPSDPAESKATLLPPQASPRPAPRPAQAEKSKAARPELLDELLEEEEQPRETPQRRAEAPPQAEGKRPRSERTESGGDARQEAASPRGSDKFSRSTDTKDDFPRESREDERAALLSDNAAAQSVTALKELLSSIPKPRHDSPALRADTTLEELVITAIRPYLAEWLNRNLPDIVKQLVYKEIRKLIPEED